MGPLKDVLGNERVNNLTVAFILAASTVSFISVVGGMLFGDLFDEGGVIWQWDAFFTALVVWVISIAVGWWVNSQSK